MKKALLGIGSLLLLVIFSAAIWVSLPRTSSTDWYSALQAKAESQTKAADIARKDSQKNAYASTYFNAIRQRKIESDVVRSWIVNSRDNSSSKFSQSYSAFNALKEQRIDALSRPSYLTPFPEEQVDINSALLAIQAEVAELRLLLTKNEEEEVLNRTEMLLRFAGGMEAEPRLASLAGASQGRLEVLRQLGDDQFLNEWNDSSLDRLSAMLYSTLSPHDQFLVTATAEWNTVEQGVVRGLEVHDISWIWKFPGVKDRELRIARNTHLELIRRIRSGKFTPPSWLSQPSSSDLFRGRCGIVTTISSLSLDGPLELWSRARATQWGLAVSYSLLRFRRANGHYPSTLDQIPEAEILQDPLKETAKYAVLEGQVELTITLPVKLPSEWGQVQAASEPSLVQHNGNRLIFRLPTP